jgi:methionyl-tRNA synthetase
MKPFYITTTLPYVNADPHIGHAMEFIRADVIARFWRGDGREVFFNTGTDEHGQKIWEGAQKEGLTPKEYTDKYSSRFKEFCQLTNISYDGFLRTTEDRHIAAAQKMWNICLEKGDIYKARQTINYCVGCEMEKTDSELVDGKCPDHPNRDLVISEEENYFFKFSKYQNDLLELYSRGLIKPETRQNEIKSFVQAGLHDFSVSRLKSKMPWGVPVPGDDDHVMYVWFDALNSYISTLGWGSENEETFAKFWAEGEVTQYCGKDNNKAQSAIWQAMLLSSGLKNTDTININGHIISGGVKMSKSIGNVISPFDIIEKYKSVTDYPEEVLRFVMCHEVSTYDDSDITMDSISSAYTAFLQNGIGNQLNRILKLSSQYLGEDKIKEILSQVEKTSLDQSYKDLLANFKINEAVHIVTDKVKSLDEYIQSTEPFKLVKNDETLEKGREIISKCIFDLLDIGHHLYYFMPKTAMFIYDHASKNKMPEKPLFNRLG